MSELMERNRLRFEAEQEKALQRCPTCDVCGEKIQTEGYHELDNTKYCMDCWDDFCSDCYVEATEEYE